MFDKSMPRLVLWLVSLFKKRKPIVKDSVVYVTDVA